MATTDCDLYRSVMGNSFKKIKHGVYPGDGVLDPRWETTEYFSKKRNKTLISRADVTIVTGKQGPEVQSGSGTSLHDVPKWFKSKEFWIPEGTEYTQEIVISKDSKKKTSPVNPKVTGYHYQLEPKTQMSVVAFKGALDNMARAAVARQCKLART